MEQYLNKEVIYVLRILAKEFIKEFYKKIIQGYNKAIGLVLKL